MKYIVLASNSQGVTQEFPFVFTTYIPFKVMANAVVALMKEQWPDIAPVAAGEFCSISGTCTGKSDALDLRSRGITDELLISVHDSTAGFVI